MQSPPPPRAVPSRTETRQSLDTIMKSLAKNYPSISRPPRCVVALYCSGLFCFACRTWRVHDRGILLENLSGRMQRSAIFSSQILPLECSDRGSVVEAAREFDSGSAVENIFICKKKCVLWIAFAVKHCLYFSITCITQVIKLLVRLNFCEIA